MMEQRTTTTEAARPVPVPDEETAPFWQAAAEGRLAFQRCDHCGHLAHPPVAFCEHCHQVDAPSFSFADVTGRGRIVNWTVVHDAMVQGFGPEPWVHALVALDEQDDLLYTATLVDGPQAAIAIGDPVLVEFLPVAPGTNLPVFRLQADGFVR